MTKFLTSISITLLLLAPLLGVLGSRSSAMAQQSDEPTDTEQRVVDITADVVYPYKIGDTLDVYCLVGDFAAQHNGAIITADSAVRYSDKRIECYGNVIINKNTTYAYADWATYDGDKNEAQLFAPIIKVVDEQTTLYTYDFVFNTQTSIGYYSHGGVTLSGDNLVESISGFFDSNNKTLTGVGDVLLRSEEYDMSGDSVIYNTETEFAQFFNATNIWNDNGDYLYTDRGEFDKDDDRYTFTKNGYILTEEQEIWSDSLDYYRAEEHVVMRYNIQLDDTTHKSMSFGDYGEYWRNPGNVTMTRNPSVVNYDPEQGTDTLFMRADTILILTINTEEVKRLAEKRRADSLIMVRQLFVEDSISRVEARAAAALHDSLEREGLLHDHDHDHDLDHNLESILAGEGHEHDHGDHDEEQGSDIIAIEGDTLASSSIDSYNAEDAASTEEQSELVETADETIEVEEFIELIPLDSTQVEYIFTGAVAHRIAIIDEMYLAGEVDSIAVEELKLEAAQADTIAMRTFIKELRRSDSVATLKMRLDTLDDKAQKRVIKQVLDKRKAAEKRAADKVRAAELAVIGEARLAKRIEKLDAEKARAARQSERQGERQGFWKRLFGRDDDYDTLSDSDSLSLVGVVDSLALDSLALDSLMLDSLALDSLMLDSLMVDSLQVDSLYRLVIGQRNSRTYRSDFQTVSDSLVTNSADSTIRLYYSPIMWHNDNQIVSDQADIYTENQELTHADFTGTPLMSSRLYEDDTTYFNQIAGRVITTYFRDREVYMNHVEGNAQTLYYMQDEESGDLTGLMVMESGSATFYIEEQAVVGITYRTSPVYIIHPIEKIPANQSLFLKNFKWHEDIRPQRESVFDRTIRDSQRDEKRALEMPEFPINEELEQQKRNLIEDGMWRERSELIDAKREAWLNSLGFKSGQPREEGDDPFNL